MKIKSPFAIGAWSLVSTAAIRQWMGTLDCKADFGDPTVDPVHPGYRGAKIYVFWHENILLPLYIRGHSNISMLLSRHWDANILDRVARMMGFGVVRGSTFHGGSAALRELAARAAEGNLTITPDGPRGPAREAAQGVAAAAMLARVAVVPVAYSVSRAKFLRSWDRFMVPLPFGRGVMIWGDALPAPATRAEVDAFSAALKARLDALCEDADRMTGLAAPECGA